MWFVETKPEIVTTPIEVEKKDIDVGGASSNEDTKMIEESKITIDSEKKGSASDDEEIEEERSWRRGYDGE